MTRGDTDVLEALGKIAAAIPHRGELYEKWQTDIASDRVGTPNIGASGAIRDALLHAALLGLLEADAAEGLAATLNCGPLANRQDVSKFDPRDDAYWSLPMAMAWMMSRDWKKTARQKANFRAADEHWYCQPNVGLPKNGRLNGYVIGKSWQLRNLRPATIGRLLFGLLPVLWTVG